jgi:hypothetical protein
MTTYNSHVTLLTPWSGTLLEKLIVAELVKKFPVFRGTRMFITVFSSVHHRSLSRESSPQSSPCFLIRFKKSSHLHLGLPSVLFPSNILDKNVCLLHLSHVCPDILNDISIRKLKTNKCHKRNITHFLYFTGGRVQRGGGGGLRCWQSHMQSI